MSKNGLKLTQVGLPLLKMDKIIEYLNLDPGVEVEQVRNVGKIKASDVARIATEEEGNKDLDNSTVLNAINLNGIKASDYLSKEEAIDLRTFAKQVSKDQSLEVRRLRDELYQTREELVRYGVLSDRNLYNGCYDIFSKDRIKYDDNSYELVDNIEQNSNILHLEDTADFFIGEKIAIVKTNKNQDPNSTPNEIIVTVVTIEDIENDTLIVDKKLTTASAEDITIRKTAGEYDEGTFVFAKVMKDVLTGSEMHTTFLDDKYVTKIPIDKSETGFGVSFRVDNKVTGALKSFEVVAEPVNGREKQGCQGMTCYVIKDTEKNRKLFTNIKDIENLENETGRRLIIAKSNPSKTRYVNGFIKFDFERNGSYPKLYNTGKENHLFIFADENADKDTHWKIEFATTNVDKELEDLHKHNVSYLYDPTGSKNDPSLTKPNYLNNRELRFSLKTETIRDKSYIPYKEGLYTRVIDLPRFTPSTNIRTTLRTARETNLKIASNSFIIGKGGEESENASNIAAITVKPDRGVFSSGPINQSGYYGIEKDDKVVIGQHMYTVEAVNGNEIYVRNDDPIFKEIRQGDMIHRCSYKVSVRGYNYEIETDEDGNHVKKINEDDHIIIPLEFKQSVIDEHTTDPNSTNRLIFETEFTEENSRVLKEYEHFELQIEWDSNFDFNKEKSRIETKEDYIIFENLIGRIKELVVSFSKSNYTDKLEDYEVENNKED